MSYKIFPKTISEEEKSALRNSATYCRSNILQMTTLAGSGHPGGSMSSIDILLTLYKYANISPELFKESAKRDRVIVSIGHISPGVYSCLAENKFFPMDEAVSQFRLAGTIYEGHIERSVPGVEWTTGNLGQGLSAGCGMALSSRLQKLDNFVYVLMGDGEQQKGQISEARRFAVKYKLNNLIAIIDFNKLQISGSIHDIMPQNISEEYKSAGWNVIEIDGHNYDDIVKAINTANNSDVPSVIIANTIMGKGVSSIENKAKYHGSALSYNECEEALKELNARSNLSLYKKLRDNHKVDLSLHKIPEQDIRIPETDPIIYDPETYTDCRSAYGNALLGLVSSSHAVGSAPIVVFDCDLASSVKTKAIEDKYPDRFFQVGISEHNATSIAGAISADKIVPFLSSFTMFSVDESYNQLRMNDINKTNLKVVSTHAGIDVGEDGRTHQCIDYLGLLRNLFGFKVMAPADPNQTDHIIRYATHNYGNMHVIMGRSKVPVITKEKDGTPFFDENYVYEYGKIDIIREGKFPLIAFGNMVYRAIQIKELLAKEGISIGVYNASSPTSLDPYMLSMIARQECLIFTLEDHIPYSGLFSTVTNTLLTIGEGVEIVHCGVENYAYSGTPDEVYKLIGLDPASVARKIRASIL